VAGHAQALTAKEAGMQHATELPGRGAGMTPYPECRGAG
jgi:hypothetical protein